MDIKQQILEFMRTRAYRPLSAEDLAAELNIVGDELEQFFAGLQELEQTAIIIKTRYDKYGLPEKMNLVVGRLSIHHKGFGFLLPDNPGQADVFVAAESLMTAMHNDRVVVRLHSRPEGERKQEGAVIRIVERANQQIVGTYQAGRRFGFVIPDDGRLHNDIFIPNEDNLAAEQGDKVVVAITVWPEAHRSAEAKVVESLGKPGTPGLEVLSLLKRHQLPTTFPELVEQEAAAIPTEVTPSAITAERHDLRELAIVTIDGEDAKDLDDAVYVERIAQGNYRLSVHIADVSYYVKENSQLDLEARERGTSVYLVDRVLPMLPPRLSNGICSLNAGQDRLVLTCEMEITPRGRVADYHIYQSIIKVSDRLTYTTVRRVLTEPDSGLCEQYQHQLPHLKLMEQLCHILRRRRMRRGAIDFDLPELKVKLDEHGKAVDIIKRERSIAESIIEEFMLVANETVAQHMSKLKLPFIYRIHEEPDSEKLLRLEQLLTNFNLHLGPLDEIKPLQLQKILTKISGRPEEKIISSVMLRSLKQARYEDDNRGHFGLAARYYTHFTSPIRRYPDLIVHRLLRATMNKQLSKKRRQQWQELLPSIAMQSSNRERAAAEAERESVELKTVEYMEQFLEQDFAGIISGVTAFGVFVELENGVEGLVHVSSMDDDFYVYLEQQYMLLGERSRRIYRLGDPVTIRVVKVNSAERTIDFRFTAETIRNRSRDNNTVNQSITKTKPAAKPTATTMSDTDKQQRQHKRHKSAKHGSGSQKKSRAKKTKVRK